MWTGLFHIHSKIHLWADSMETHLLHCYNKKVLPIEPKHLGYNKLHVRTNTNDIFERILL